MLRIGTSATAREAERSIIDIETLQHTNQQLIATLDEVVTIQNEGAQRRREAEVELGRIEGELKQKLFGAARLVHKTVILKGGAAVRAEK